MGTKENPSQFDCYDKAAPDEPMFILLARDPIAPYLVTLWANVNAGDIFSAYETLQEMIRTHVSFVVHNDGTKTNNNKKMEEALECADAMIDWKEDHPP